MKKFFEDLIIYENENFDLHQDWYIPIPWFFILAAKNLENRSVSDFTEEEAYNFIDITRKIRKIMKEKLLIDDVYFFQNEDTEHWFHLWIFPRLDWMEKFWRKIESVRSIMNYAKENMFLEENIKKVKEYVEIAKEEFKK